MSRSGNMYFFGDFDNICLNDKDKTHNDIG